MSPNGRNGGDDEIMLGESLKSSSEKQTVDDVMLGRAYTPEKSVSVAPRPTEVGELHSTETPEERFVELQRLTDGYLTDDERDMLERAFRFADAAHKGVTRKSGEPYIIHPVEVAIILADLRMDGETLCAALLHDTIEDTDVTYQDVATEFNENVAALVDGVTKITRIEVESLSDKQAATIRKMFVAMSKDIRVIVIKLADRLHNMRTLSALKEDRRIFKARETLEIYAPIAHRLGINSVKWELEDLSFYYLEPNKYKQVSRMVTESRAEREQYLGEVIDTLHDEMKKVNIVCQIMGRPKHLYSIYQKMVNKGKGFSEIYDLIAVRIIVKSVKDCYSALGAVHTLWHPMPGAIPKTTSPCRGNFQHVPACTLRSSKRLSGPAKCRFVPGDASPKRIWRGLAKLQGKGEKADRYARSTNAGAGSARWSTGRRTGPQDSREFLKDEGRLAQTEVFIIYPEGEVMSAGGIRRRSISPTPSHRGGQPLRGREVNGAIVPLTSCSWATAWKSSRAEERHALARLANIVKGLGAQQDAGVLHTRRAAPAICR